MATINFRVEFDGIATYLHIPAGAGEVVVSLSPEGVSATILDAQNQRLTSVWATHQEIEQCRLEDDPADETDFG